MHGIALTLPGSIEALPIPPVIVLIGGLGVVSLIAGVGLAIMRQSESESSEPESPVSPTMGY